MRTVIALLLTGMLAGMPRPTLADSPITSTPFHEAYRDVEIVRHAREEGVMSFEFARYLSAPGNPIDVKAALINALSWSIDGKSNAELYACYLALHYRTPREKLRAELLNADEVFCLGYLTVMDDYFHPEKAIPLLEQARERRRDSFTVAIVLALTRAQKAMETDWNEVWKLAEKVFKDQELRQDLRPEARRVIEEYMVLYRPK